MAVASTGIVGGLQGTGPVFALFNEFAPSSGLSLPVEEREPFGLLKSGKHDKTGSSDCSQSHKHTATVLQGEVFETLLHGRTAGMLRQS